MFGISSISQSALGDAPAINDKFSANHIARIFTGEEQQGANDLNWIGQTTKRNSANDGICDGFRLVIRFVDPFEVQ
jgi:hypothetical protein